jgi:hypothetical protein
MGGEPRRLGSFVRASFLTLGCSLAGWRNGLAVGIRPTRGTACRDSLRASHQAGAGRCAGPEGFLRAAFLQPEPKHQGGQAKGQQGKRYRRCEGDEAVKGKGWSMVSALFPHSFRSSWRTAFAGQRNATPGKCWPGSVLSAFPHFPQCFSPGPVHAADFRAWADWRKGITLPVCCTASR